MVHVRTATLDDVAQCVAVLGALPDFFTLDTHEKLAAEMRVGRTWVAEVESRDICGFIHVMQRSERSAEITFAAVLPESRRQGIGRALVAAAVRALRDTGVVLVEVKTLDATSNYEPYVATRAFWESQGFVQLDMIDPLPGWQSGNPSAIYVAALERRW